MVKRNEELGRKKDHKSIQEPRNYINCYESVGTIVKIFRSHVYTCSKLCKQLMRL